MNTLGTSPRRQSYGLYFVVLSALVLAMLGYFLNLSHRQTTEAIETACRNEASVIANEIDVTLRRIDSESAHLATMLLEGGGASHLTEGESRRLSKAFSDLRANFPEAWSYHLLDADGRHVLGDSDRPVANSIMEREFFRDLRSQPKPGLLFSGSLHSRPSGALSMYAHRAMLGQDGAFLGLIVMSIDLGHFQREFSTIQVGDRGMVSIRRTDDSRLVVRWPIVEEELDQPATQTPPYRLILGGAHAGVVRYVGKTDGVERIFAFKTVSKFPFYVLVGRAVDEQFQSWRTTAGIAMALTLSGLGLLAWFLFGLRRAESTLRSSEERYRAIIEVQHDPVCRWRLDSTLTFANQQYTKLFAPGRDDLTGRRWIDFVPEESRQAVLDQYAALARSPEAFQYEHAVTLSDGSQRWFQWVDVPLLDADGKCTEFQSVGRDITEQKQAEAALRAREDVLSAIVAQASDAIELTDLETLRFVEFNYTSCSLLGYNQEEYAKLTVHDVQAGIPKDELQAMMDQGRIGDELHFETQHRRKDGSLIDVQVSLRFIELSGRRHVVAIRSEERRVGKECRRLCRSRWSPYH
jgi:PAS domain S-box-containing protein